MITTVTPNPSLDRTVAVAELVPGGINRTETATVEAGGKGVNVAAALVRNGHAAQAVFPAGGQSGEQFLAILEGLGVPTQVVRTEADVRSNISVIEADGRTTKLNEPGETLSGAQLAELIDCVVEAAAGSMWVAACGSLPPGAPSDFYAQLAVKLGRVSLAVDTSGPALAAMVGVKCALLKPNRSELSDALGVPVQSLAEAVAAAQVLRQRGTERVLVSLGSDGALLVEDEGVMHGTAPTSDVRNTVGAGDALLAGFLAGGGSGADALRVGLAWARATVRTETTGMALPDQNDVQAVSVVPMSEQDPHVQGALEDLS